MRRLGRRQICLASGLAAMMLVGCGDSGGGTPDAKPPTPDARPPDAAAPDAAPAPTYSGTIALHDVSLFGAPTAGHGLQSDISFSQDGAIPEMFSGQTSLPPCYATLVDVTKPAQRNPPSDEGTVKFVIKDSGGTTKTTLPNCNFSNGSYTCASGQGTAGAFAANGAGNPVWTFTGTGQTAAIAGEYLIILPTAGPPATPQIAVPIVGVSGMTLGVASTVALPASVGAWITAAGIGPVPFTSGVNGPPSGAAPELLADTDKVQVSLTGKTGTHLGSPSTSDISAGTAFEPDDATAALLAAGVNIATPADTTFGCKKTVGGATCPAAAGTIVTIDGTDTTPAAGSPTDFPASTKWRGSLTCASFAETVTIPTALLNVIKAGSPKRLRIVMFRDGFAPVGRINVVAGHGIVRFQDVTQ